MNKIITSGGKKRDPAYATGNYRIEDRSFDDLSRSRPKPASFEEYSEMQPADRAVFILDTVKVMILSQD